MSQLINKGGRPPKDRLMELQEALFMAGDLSTFKAEVQERGRKLRTGDGRRDMLKSLIGHLSGQFQEDREIKDTLRALVAESFDPADPVDWSDIDALVDNISAKDAELRAQGARHAKNIMESARLNALAFSPAGEPAGTVTMSAAENWLDAVKDYKAPLHHWKEPPPTDRLTLRYVMS